MADTPASSLRQGASFAGAQPEANELDLIALTKCLQLAAFDSIHHPMKASDQTRLCQATAAALPPDVARPGYDRSAPAVGILHFGIGAFHRAHQAVYTDCAMAGGDRDWVITGVSLRSAGVRDQLGHQDGLYTVTEKSTSGENVRLIGSVRNVLVATEEPQAVVEALASPSVRVVSFTITEKGYHRRADGELDRDDPLVAVDRREDGPPRTLYGFLRKGLALRRARGLGGVTLLCCDNLPENGRTLSALVGSFLEDVEPPLRAWFEAECSCPSTMVDRIVPAVTPNDLGSIEQRLGMRDEGAVVAEPFSQWVIEDRFAAGRPNWEVAGAEFVDDVRPYETAKLRMLNGAHSALAYLGLRRGHRFVHEAVADPQIRPIVEQLMRQEAASTLSKVGGFDSNTYANRLLERFANPALPHRLDQIAMDGSQKIPQRWLATLRHHQNNARQCPAILASLAAWIIYVRGDSLPVDDPMAKRLAELWRTAGSGGIVDALFGRLGLFASHWQATPTDAALILQHMEDWPARQAECS